MKLSRSIVHRVEWLVVLVVGAIAAVLGAGGYGPNVPIVLGFTLIATAIVLFDLVRAQKHNDDDRRPLGLLLITGGQLFAVAGLLVSETWESSVLVTSILVVVAGAFAAGGAMHVVSHRFGSHPEITARETAIVSAGLTLTFFVLIVLELDFPIPLTEQLAKVLLTAAVGLAVFATLYLYWLAGHEKGGSLPLLFTAAAPTCTVVVAANLAGAFDSFLAIGLAVLGLAFASAAYLYPDAASAFTPAIMTTSEVNVRRSLISFSVVLVGPLLVAFHQFTSLDLSLLTITIGSSALSLVVAVHLLGLVRRWVAVEHQGQHDPLTNLPNRPLFFNRLEMAIESARLRDARFVTMFLDLDRFKAVNDTLGHEAGDELLRQVAQRLNDASLRVGSNLTVARLGGDEFAILVPSVKDARHSHAIGRLFLDQFLEPFDVGLRDIYVTPSIGIAEFPKDGGSVKELIENADTAMFEAKERGRNMVVSYSPEQRVPGAHRLEIEAALHRAIENKELKLFFQPQIDISTGQIFAVESLIRWEHPTLGMISPDKFVPVAEESTLIDNIGEWTIDEACRSAARWSDIGLPPINIAVNLSPRQFQKSVHLVDNVVRALQASGLEPGRLELELTESLALEKPEQVNETLVRFREMGIRTAIDDFGVGHTGLDYLDRIEVDTLKIDRSFINRIGESGAPLVTAVISLARGLNLDVIAEGVETREQVNFLVSHGCRYMQGYLFSKPLTGPQLEQLLRNQKKKIEEKQAGGSSAHHAA